MSINIEDAAVVSAVKDAVDSLELAAEKMPKPYRLAFAYQAKRLELAAAKVEQWAQERQAAKGVRE